MTILENRHDQTKCNNLHPFLNFRKMARTFNSKYDFDEGFFTCDIPKDAIQLVLKIKTKLGQHTLTEDCERWTEKYRPWEKHTKGSPRKRLESLSPKKIIDTSMTSHSGPWLPTPEFEYRPKIFDDPRNTSSDKENAPTNTSISDSPTNNNIRRRISGQNRQTVRQRLKMGSTSLFLELVHPIWMICQELQSS